MNEKHEDNKKTEYVVSLVYRLPKKNHDAIVEFSKKYVDMLAKYLKPVSTIVISSPGRRPLNSFVMSRRYELPLTCLTSKSEDEDSGFLAVSLRKYLVAYGVFIL